MNDVLQRLKAALADRYEIQEELGAGGMATVYLAEDVKHHRKVAEGPPPAPGSPGTRNAR